jgi:hypothetical protein
LFGVSGGPCEARPPTHPPRGPMFGGVRLHLPLGGGGGVSRFAGSECVVLGYLRLTVE